MITISFIIPMYNEEKRIASCIRVLRKFKPPDEVEINRVIFVSDGSTDNTVQVVQKMKIPFPKQIVAYKKNMGRGYALRKAMRNIDSDYALWFDADMSTPLSEVKNFLSHMKKGVPVIIGSRKIHGANVTKRQPLYRIILGQGFSKLSEIILQVPVSDFTCGFKAFSRNAYQKIYRISQLNRWGHDCESLFLAKKFGFTIKELPIHWRNDPNTRVKLIRDLYQSFIELLIIRGYELMGKYEKSSMYKNQHTTRLEYVYE